MSSHMIFEQVLEVRCSKCGRVLGHYRGEAFWIMGVQPFDAKILCVECKKETSG